MEDFIPFPKVPRLSRECVITEKIDGTNASIWISDHGAIRVASRKRFITPGKGTDNFGFAGWAQDNVEELAKLGPGVHHGEWWGGKIQRGYGLTEKRFSLFNTHLWDKTTAPACCHVVPWLWRGTFDTNNVDWVLASLKATGSIAAPGFDHPEGIMVYHGAANQYFKKTYDDDDTGKSS